MADRRPDLSYSLIVHSTGMQFRIFLNGAYVYGHLRLREALYTIPLDSFLKEGDNLLEITYEPFNDEERNFTPTEGMKLELELFRTSYSGRGTDPREAEIHLFSGQYDAKQGELIPGANQQSVFGSRTLVTSQNGLQTSGQYKLEPTKIIYGNRESDEFARKLSISFAITDSILPTPPWIDAEVLKDTPAMRDELYDAYHALYQSIKTRDRDAFAKLAHIMYDHEALVLGYKDGPTMANAIMDNDHAFWKQNDPLEPFPSRAEFAKQQLYFGTTNQLVRADPGGLQFQPSPEYPEGSILPYYFCRPRGQELRVCYSEDTPAF